MATQQWKTLSVRLTEDEENALKILCEKRGQTKHAIVKSLLLRELDPILKPGSLPEGEGIPLIGEHMFKYNPEKDNFTWQLDLGAYGIQVLGENIPFTFIENISRAIEKAKQQKETVEAKMSKKKTRVPKSILKYKVIKNARS